MGAAKGWVPRVVRAAIAGSTLVAMVACKSSAPPVEGRPPEPTPAPVAMPPAPGPTRIEITSDGFQPPRLALGASRQVVFRRTTDSTCATAVVFPDLGIEKPLPLSADVAVDLPLSAHGEISFQCGMGMYKSKLVVR